MTLIILLGNLTDVSVGEVINNNFYIFHLESSNVTWSRATVREFAQPQPQPTSIIRAFGG